MTCAHPATLGRPVGLRLTRRGRLVIGLLLSALAVTVFALRGWGGSDPTIPDNAPSHVVVQPGDTLWDIADQIAPGRDARQVVDEIQRINHLDSVTVRPGQELFLHR